MSPHQVNYWLVGPIGEADPNIIGQAQILSGAKSGLTRGGGQLDSITTMRGRGQLD